MSDECLHAAIGVFTAVYPNDFARLEPIIKCDRQQLVRESRHDLPNKL